MVKKRIPKTIIEKSKKLKDSIEADNIPVNHIYLFGSYAKGNAHRWSDIDLCVISSAFGKKIKQPMNYLWGKRVILHDFSIEPVGFNPNEFKEASPLISEIKKHGIKIL